MPDATRPSVLARLLTSTRFFTSPRILSRYGRRGWLGVLLAAVLSGLLTGCATAPKHEFVGPTTTAHPLPAEPATSPRSLPMFSGLDGRPLRWDDLLRAAAWAEIIVIGEQHDDAVGHAVEIAVTRDVLTRWPGSAVALEMFERDDQPIVDDYLDGIIDQPTLVRRTFSASWGNAGDGDGTWDEWFQPVVDAARDTGSRVIAANAPRRYVRLARSDGYERLRQLPASRRQLIHIPPRLPDGPYRERFAEVMDRMSNGDDDGSHRVDPGYFESIFRSQMLWDATMAHSIIRARPSKARKVVHLVGQFHSDFEGGTILELRRHRPAARILTISMQRREGDALHVDDRDRADIIIYTGLRPADEDEPADEIEPQFDDEDAQDVPDVSGGDEVPKGVHDTPGR